MTALQLLHKTDETFHTALALRQFEQGVDGPRFGPAQRFVPAGPQQFSPIAQSVVQFSQEGVGGPVADRLWLHLPGQPTQVPGELLHLLASPSAAGFAGAAGKGTQGGVDGLLFLRHPTANLLAHSFGQIAVGPVA